MEGKHLKRKASREEIGQDLAPRGERKKHKKSKNSVTVRENVIKLISEEYCSEKEDISHECCSTESDKKKKNCVEDIAKDSFKNTKSKKKSSDSKSRREKEEVFEEEERKQDSGVLIGKVEDQEGNVSDSGSHVLKSKHRRDKDKKKRKVKSDLQVEDGASNRTSHQVTPEENDECKVKRKKEKKCDKDVSLGTFLDAKNELSAEHLEEHKDFSPCNAKKKKKKKKSEKSIFIATEESESPEENENTSHCEERKKKKEKKKKKTKDKVDDCDDDVVDEQNESDPRHPALLYLHQWKVDKGSWRFQKVRQTWLLQNMFNKQKVPDKVFGILMEYLQGLKGTSRQKTITDAEKLIENEETIDESDTCLDRVKQVVQQITED